MVRRWGGGGGLSELTWFTDLKIHSTANRRGFETGMTSRSLGLPKPRDFGCFETAMTSRSLGLPRPRDFGCFETNDSQKIRSFTKL